MRRVYNIGVRRFVAGVPDAHGNVEEGYEPEAPFPVFVVAPRGSTSDEPLRDRDETETLLDVYCPPGPLLGSQDVLVIGGKDFDVIGYADDFTDGPYGAGFGVVYQVRRVEG